MGIGTAAHAGNREGIFFGEQALLSGGAVRAIVDDGSATIYNPSGLGDIDTPILNVSLSAFQFRTQRLRDAFVLNEEEAYSVRGSELTPLPNSISFSRPFLGDWRLGLGIFTMRFQNTTFELAGRTETPAYVFDTDIDLVVKQNAFRAGAGLGRQLSDRVSFGFSLAVLWATYSLTASTATDLSVPGTTISNLFYSRERETKVGMTGIVGTTVKISPQWTFASVLELPTLRVYQTNRTKTRSLTGTLTDESADDFSAEREDTRNVRDKNILLDFLRLHASFAYESSRWTVSLEGDVALEAGLESSDTLHAVWNVRAGAQYTTEKHVTFGFGVFTDRAQKTETFESAFESYQFTGVSAGLRFQNEHELDENDETRKLTFSTAFGLRYAYGFNHFEPTRLSDPDDEADAALSYQFAHELALYISSRIQF